MIMADYPRFFLALAVVLGLIALFAWVVKRLRLGGFGQPIDGSGRLEVIDSLSIDGRQRLLLIRRDRLHHLILLGQERSLVIETGIDPDEKLPLVETGAVQSP